jgi:hypothetical protein
LCSLALPSPAPIDVPPFPGLGLIKATSNSGRGVVCDRVTATARNSSVMIRRIILSAKNAARTYEPAQEPIAPHSVLREP